VNASNNSHTVTYGDFDRGVFGGRDASKNDPLPFGQPVLGALA
jgi:hypothetical protein